MESSPPDRMKAWWASELFFIRFTFFGASRWNHFPGDNRLDVRTCRDSCTLFTAADQVYVRQSNFLARSAWTAV